MKYSRGVSLAFGLPLEDDGDRCETRHGRGAVNRKKGQETLR